MSETETTQSPIEKLNLTEAQEAERKAAETWLRDAQAAYTAEIKDLQAQNQRATGSKVGHSAVAPHISSAPEHIKRGTQIDQEIWKAENAEEDDYETRMDEDRYGPTAEDFAWDDRENRISQIEDVLDGDDELSGGLDGTLSMVETGFYTNRFGDELDVASTSEDLMRYVAPYADLQTSREAAITQEQPDPLTQQMSAEFHV